METLEIFSVVFGIIGTIGAIVTVILFFLHFGSKKRKEKELDRMQKEMIKMNDWFRAIQRMLFNSKLYYEAFSKENDIKGGFVNDN